MSDEVSGQLEQRTTGELVEILQRNDSKEWRPEVFPIVESILRRRGVDVAAIRARRPDRVTAAPAPEDDDSSPDFLKALDLPNAALLPLAKSLLEQAGLQYFVKGENAQSLFALGQLGTGYNLVAGPPVLMVEAARVQEARELLEPLLREAVLEPRDEGEGE